MVSLTQHLGLFACSSRVVVFYLRIIQIKSSAFLLTRSFSQACASVLPKVLSVSYHRAFLEVHCFARDPFLFLLKKNPFPVI